MKTIIFSILPWFLLAFSQIGAVRWQATTQEPMTQEASEKGRFLHYFNDVLECAGPHGFLVFGLLIAVLASMLLWWKNRVMSAEIKMRTEAQNLLSLANKRIRKQAYTDDLSGMGNRRAFYQQGEAEIKLAKLDKRPIAALLIDIDCFKSINDQFGHAFGDKAIQKLAKVILDVVRANDVQGRIGGEEFGILTPNTNLKGAEDLAERIRLAAEAIELRVGKQMIKMTVSIGVAAFKLDDDCLRAMMARADEGLYQAKRLGRNRVVVRS